MAQYGEGSIIETHRETSIRRLEEWDTRWQQLEEEFKSVKPGKDLAMGFFSIKKIIAGSVSKQLALRDKVYEIDMERPRTVREIQDRRFGFRVLDAQVAVNGSIVEFKSTNKQVFVTKYDRVSDRENIETK